MNLRTFISFNDTKTLKMNIYNMFQIVFVLQERCNENDTSSKKKKGDGFLDLLNGSEDINEQGKKNNNIKQNKK